MSELAVVPRQYEKALAKYAGLHDAFQEYQESTLSEATRTAYQSDWSDFCAFCQEIEADSLPAHAAVVTMYVVQRAEDGLKVSSLQRRLAAISHYHREAGEDNPASTAVDPLRRIWKGIRRKKGTGKRKMAPLLLDELRAILEALPPSRLIAKRDRALLLLGWAGSFRRSELSNIQVRDLDFHKEGLVVTLPRSKTDQTGETRQVYVPYGQHELTCPVRAVEKWMKAAGISDGPVFRSVDNRGEVGEGRLHKVSVGRIVKRSVERIGLDPNRYGGHSLRAGLVTEAAKRGVPDAIIMNQTGHRSFDVMHGYKRLGKGFTENVLTMIGL